MLKYSGDDAKESPRLKGLKELTNFHARLLQAISLDTTCHRSIRAALLFPPLNLDIPPLNLDIPPLNLGFNRVRLPLQT